MALALLQHSQDLLSKRTNGARGNGGSCNSNCHNCGKPGYWARDCPDPKKPHGFSGHGNGCQGNPGQESNGGRGNGSFNSNRNRQGNDARSAWKTTPPVASNRNCTKILESKGVAKWEQTQNGKLFMWCGNCGCWSTTHWTNEHTQPVRHNAGANHAGIYQLGDHGDSDDDLGPCAFFVHGTEDKLSPFAPFNFNAFIDHNTFSSTLDAEDFWSLIFPYLPGLMLFLWWFFSSPFAPALLHQLVRLSSSSTASPSRSKSPRLSHLLAVVQAPFPSPLSCSASEPLSPSHLSHQFKGGASNKIGRLKNIFIPESHLRTIIDRNATINTNSNTISELELVPILHGIAITNMNDTKTIDGIKMIISGKRTKIIPILLETVIVTPIQEYHMNRCNSAWSTMHYVPLST
jgi:hypothetical protein